MAGIGVAEEVRSTSVAGLDRIVPGRSTSGQNIAGSSGTRQDRDVHRAAAINSTLAGPKWVVATMESALIRMATEWGRVVGILGRGEIECLGHRFDWFTNRAGDGPRNEERMNSVQRAAVIVVLLAVSIHAFHQ